MEYKNVTKIWYMCRSMAEREFYLGIEKMSRLVVGIDTGKPISSNSAWQLVCADMFNDKTVTKYTVFNIKKLFIKMSQNTEIYVTHTVGNRIIKTVVRWKKYDSCPHVELIPELNLVN